MAELLDLPPEELAELCPSGYTLRGRVNIAVASVLLSLALLTVTLRVYVRKQVTRALWWDDLALVMALLFYIPTSAITFAEVYSGVGKHAYCLDFDAISKILRLGLVVEIMLSFCIAFPRLAVALLVLRVFSVSKRLKITLYCYCTFMTIGMCVTAGLLSAVCTPREKFFIPWTAGKCWSFPQIHSIGYLNGSISIFSDLFLALLPVIYLRNLQMQKTKKVGLSFLMGLGFLAAAFAVVRTWYFPKLLQLDVTYDSANLLLFTNLECGIAIVAAAIPGLWPLISGRFKSSRRSPRASPPQPSPNDDVSPNQNSGQSAAKSPFWLLPLFTFENKSRVLSGMEWTMPGSEDVGREDTIKDSTTSFEEEITLTEPETVVVRPKETY